MTIIVNYYIEISRVFNVRCFLSVIFVIECIIAPTLKNLLGKLESFIVYEKCLVNMKNKNSKTFSY